VTGGGGELSCAIEREENCRNILVCAAMRTSIMTDIRKFFRRVTPLQLHTDNFIYLFIHLFATWKNQTKLKTQKLCSFTNNLQNLHKFG
jgi:hypothetical protein